LEIENRKVIRLFSPLCTDNIALFNAIQKYKNIIFNNFWKLKIEKLLHRFRHCIALFNGHNFYM